MKNADSYAPAYLASHDGAGTVPQRRHNLNTTRPLVSVFTLAEHLQVHHRTAQRWTRQHLIPYYRVGKSIRYDIIEVLSSAAEKAHV